MRAEARLPADCDFFSLGCVFSGMVVSDVVFVGEREGVRGKMYKVGRRAGAREYYVYSNKRYRSTSTHRPRTGDV
jgi:hypothetical protein